MAATTELLQGTLDLPILRPSPSPYASFAFLSRCPVESFRDNIAEGGTLLLARLLKADAVGHPFRG